MFQNNSCKIFLPAVLVVWASLASNTAVFAAVSPVTVSTGPGVAITIDLTTSISNDIVNPDVQVPSSSVNGGSIRKIDSVNIEYTPPANFIGNDSFIYSVLEESATITVEVGSTADSGVNTPIKDLKAACDRDPNSEMCELVADYEATAGIALEDNRIIERQLEPLELIAQGQIGNSMAQDQMDNINKRLVALRRGMVSAALGNLAFVIDGKMVTANLLEDAFGGAAGDDDNTSKNKGWFLTGSVKYGEYDETNYLAGFDFYSGSLTTGLDFKLGRKWILGGALGIGATDMTINHDEGGMDVFGLSANFYTSYYPTERTFLDFIFSGNYQNYENERRIIFDTLDDMATSTSQSTLAGIGLGGGVDMLISGPFTLTGALRLDHRRTYISEYEESGSVAAVRMNDREIQQNRSSLGLQMSIADGFSWGAMIHQMNVSWEYEITDEGDYIEYYYVNGPDEVSRIPVDSDGLSFYKAAYGIQFVRPGGNSGFIQIETTFGLENYYDVSLNGGYRTEF